MSAHRQAPRGHLLRVLGVVFGVAIIIGNTIGMGILRTPGEVAAQVPSAPLFLAVWVAGGLYSLLGALCLAELAAMHPRSGGFYPLVRRAMGPYFGFVVGWSDWIATCGTMAAVAIVLGEYAGPLIPLLDGQVGLTASAVVLIFMALQWRGIRIGDATQRATSLLKALALVALALVAIVVGGNAPETVATQIGALAPQVGGAASRLAAGALPDPAVPTGAALAVAFVIALQSSIFTFSGWAGPTYFGEEVRNPGRDLPRSMVSGVLLVLVLYLTLNVAFLRVVPMKEMAGDPFVVATMAARIFGPAGDTVLRVLMILSLIAAVNGIHLVTSRILYAMSRDGMLPARLGDVNEGGTPVPALLAGTAAALAFIATNTFDTVLSLLAFFFVANYFLVFLSVFVMRWREPDAPRPFKVPGYPWVPAIVLAGSAAFLVGSLIGDFASSIRAIVLLAVATPAYLVVRRHQTRREQSQ
ncbi:MAG: APC family permease [Gemmatimonadota bacterium]